MHRAVASLLERAYRRMRGGELRRTAGITPASWRTVERGALAGLEFFLPGGRDAPWAERLRFGEYEVDTLVAVGELAAWGGVLYDLGAHIGVFSCAWIKLGGTQVEAFEPVPSTVRVLRETLARNNFTDRVRVHNLALGDFNGSGRMIVDQSDLGAASAAFVGEIGMPDVLRGMPRVAAGPALAVTVQRLDDVLNTHALAAPAVLKLDVEGAEASIVAGALELIKTHQPAILCEVHSIEAGLILAQSLAQLGYELRILGKNGIQPTCLWTTARRGGAKA